MIEVADTGWGIPPNVLPRIFDPFFTTRREAGGTGLGLSTVHGIVRQSDGFLEVDSQPGEGARIRVYLPRWDDLAVSIPSPPLHAEPPHAAGSGQGTVLLVDDDEPVRRLAERALSRAGFAVIAADSGEAALAALAAHAASGLVGIVTDMVMHGMDGVQVVRAARALLGARDLPALLMSGYAEASLRDALASEGNVAFLAKPYALRELVEAFAAVVASGQRAAVSCSG
jgi:two-component system cell cycle sensor histidine kinase/response regulator CckA